MGAFGYELGAVTFKKFVVVDALRAGIEITRGKRSPRFTLRVEDSDIIFTS